MGKWGLHWFTNFTQIGGRVELEKRGSREARVKLAE